MLAEDKHKIERGIVPSVLPTDLNEVDHILMVKQLEDPDLPQSSEKKNSYSDVPQKLLQSHNFTAVCSTHDLEHFQKVP